MHKDRTLWKCSEDGRERLENEVWGEKIESCRSRGISVAKPV